MDTAQLELSDQVDAATQRLLDDARTLSEDDLRAPSLLPGWTRGLCIVDDIAFVGTSRIITRFAAYAPGLNASDSRCAVHAVCCKTGKLQGSLEWPAGNQIFAIDWIASDVSTGFPFDARSRKRKRELAFFYTYAAQENGKK